MSVSGIFAVWRRTCWRLLEIMDVLVVLTSNLPTGGGVTSSKNKTKGVFTTFDQSDPESDNKVSTGVHVAAGHSYWIKPGSH